LDDQIAQLALMSGEGDIIEAAKYYEDKDGHTDKSVMLYHKVGRVCAQCDTPLQAGMFGRAMELAARTEQYGALDLIAADLNRDSDPRVLERCAEFFTQNQQYAKAVELLAYAKKVHMVTFTHTHGITVSRSNSNVCIKERTTR
jgi:intraflagellar transport protein 140